MKSFVYHTQINVSDKKKSFPFYKDLLKYLGYEVVHDGSWGFGAKNTSFPHHSDIWICATETKYRVNKFNRKNIGLNHIAFGVHQKSDVEKFIKDFLEPRKIIPLYDSPREYPEYEKGYYAVYFEDPDRIKLEVVYQVKFEKLK